MSVECGRVYGQTSDSADQKDSSISHNVHRECLKTEEIFLCSLADLLFSHHLTPNSYSCNFQTRKPNVTDSVFRYNIYRWLEELAKEIQLLLTPIKFGPNVSLASMVVPR